jgi:hypothetical protein
LVVLLAGGWLALTVSRNYGGHGSALFRPGSHGYDGQFYRFLAHHPATPSPAGIDSPRLRGRRILVPILAYVLAWGYHPHIDAAYVAVVLAFLFLGVYWMARWATLHGRSPAWGLVFATLPATLVSLDRMTVDIALAALCCGWALYMSGGAHKWKTFAVLALAPLARETGALLCAASALGQTGARGYRRALLSLAAAIPAVAWWVFVALGTPPDRVNWVAYFPFSGILEAFLNGPHEPAQLPLRSVVVMLHYAALAGMALGIGLSAILWWRNRREALPIAGLLFALLAVQTGWADVWAHVFAFGRVFSPMLLVLGLRAVARGDWVLLAPLALTLPRTLAEFAPQVLGAAR